MVMHDVHIDVHVDHIHRHHIVNIDTAIADNTVIVIVVIVVGEKITAVCGQQVAVVGERFAQKIPTVAVAVIVVFLAAGVAAASASTVMMLVGA